MKAVFGKNGCGGKSGCGKSGGTAKTKQAAKNEAGVGAKNVTEIAASQGYWRCSIQRKGVKGAKLEQSKVLLIEVTLGQ